MTLSEQQRRDYKKQHSAYERRIKPIFLNALRRQIEPIALWLEANLGEPPVDALIDKTIFRQPMVQAYLLVGNMSAKRGYYLIRGNDGGVKSAIDLFINLWTEIFKDYALRYAYRIENELSETTKQEVRKALAEGRELGYSNDRIATLIRRRVQWQISRTRAILIARTEATTASNLGAEQGAKTWLKEVGQKGYKEFIGRDDERERHTHRELNGKIIPIEEKFSFGGSLALLPGDTTLPAKERIQCRCTTLFMSERRYLRMMADKK